MKRIVNELIIPAVTLQFSTQIMVKKVKDNLFLQVNQTSKNSIMGKEEVRKCKAFQKKYNGIKFPNFLTTMEKVNDFQKMILQHQVKAVTCKSKPTIARLRCLTKINIEMQKMFQKKHSHLAILETDVKVTQSIVQHEYMECVEHINKLPNIKQPFENLEVPEIDHYLPCKSYLRKIKVIGAPPPCKKSNQKSHKKLKEI